MSAIRGSHLLVGVDLGTSSVKAIAITAEGAVVGRGSAGYPTEVPRPRWAEQSPQLWWQAVGKAVRQALGKTGVSTHVTALGLAGQMNGLVLVDRHGQPVGPAMIWMDQRALPQAQRILNTAADLLAVTAMKQPTPVAALAKLLWVVEHDGCRLAQAVRVLTPTDYIRFRFCGVMATDICNASATAMLDLRQRTWSVELLERVGAPRHLLPDLVESVTVVGGVTSEASTETGLPEGTPVVGGSGDMGALMVGAGIVRSGHACVTLGSAAHMGAFARVLPTPGFPPAVILCHPAPGQYFWHGVGLTGGLSLQWIRGVVAGRDSIRADGMDWISVDSLLEEAEQVPAGCRGLLFLPYLNGLATPYYDPLARASFVGALLSHTRGDFVRAVLEGVAYNVRDSFEAFRKVGCPIDRIRIGEGGTRSLLWCQILADVLGNSLELLREPDASALGAAIIAGVGAGVYSSFAAACAQVVQTTSTISPDPTRQQLYSRLYRIYADLYPKLAETHRGLNLADPSGL